MQMQTVTTAFYCRIADVYHVLPYFYNATQTTANTPTNDVTSHLIAEKFGNEVCVRLMGAGTTQLNSQLNEHVRTQVLTPQCTHLFNTTSYETTHFLLHVLIYLQFRSGRLCNHTRYPGATNTHLNAL